MPFVRTGMPSPAKLIKPVKKTGGLSMDIVEEAVTSAETAQEHTEQGDKSDICSSSEAQQK